MVKAEVAEALFNLIRKFDAVIQDILIESCQVIPKVIAMLIDLRNRVRCMKHAYEDLV